MRRGRISVAADVEPETAGCMAIPRIHGVLKPLISTDNWLRRSFAEVEA
jgi:hypothetical protein